MQGSTTGRHVYTAYRQPDLQPLCYSNDKTLIIDRIINKLRQLFGQLICIAVHYHKQVTSYKGRTRESWGMHADGLTWIQ